MPYVSDKQRRWAHTKTGTKKLGADKVKEFDAASKGKELPESHNEKKKHKEEKSNGFKSARGHKMK